MRQPPHSSVFSSALRVDVSTTQYDTETHVNAFLITYQQKKNLSKDINMQLMFSFKW